VGSFLGGGRTATSKKYEKMGEKNLIKHRVGEKDRSLIVGRKKKGSGKSHYHRKPNAVNNLRGKELKK